MSDALGPLLVNPRAKLLACAGNCGFNVKHRSIDAKNEGDELVQVLSRQCGLSRLKTLRAR